MVETTITVTPVTKTAAAQLDTNFVTSAAGGYNFLNDGTCFLVIQTGASTTTCTVTGQGLTYNGLAVNVVTATLAANKTYVLGGFMRSNFNDGSNLVHVATSETAGVTKIGVASFTPAG